MIRKIKKTGHIPSGTPKTKGEERNVARWNIIIDRLDKEITELKNKIHHMEKVERERAKEWANERSLQKDKMNEITETNRRLYMLILEALSNPREEAHWSKMTSTEIQSEREEGINTVKEGGEKTKHEEEWEACSRRVTSSNTAGNQEEWEACSRRVTSSNTAGNQEVGQEKGEENKDGLGWRGIGPTEEGTKYKPQEATSTLNRKNNIILLGHEEPKEIDEVEKKKNEGEYIERLIRGLLGKEGNRIDFEAHRLGIPNRETTRPIRMSFRDEEIVNRILENGYKIKELRGNEKLTLRRDLTVMERRELHENLNEVRQRNSQRNDEEKEQFFYKVVGRGEIVKRYIHHPKKQKRRQKEQEGIKYSN